MARVTERSTDTPVPATRAAMDFGLSGERLRRKIQTRAIEGFIADDGRYFLTPRGYEQLRAQQNGATPRALAGAGGMR